MQRVKIVLALTLTLLCVSVFATSGCSLIPVRTVYVKPGVSVRLRQDVENIKIWVKGKDGKVLPSTITLKEGWYVMSMEKAGD